MSIPLQADRSMRITTPLGREALLLTGLEGREAISELFAFKLDLIAENTKTIAFDKLLGQPVAIRLTMDEGDTVVRHLHGICSRMAQGERDELFTAYRMEVVPAFWFLTRRVQSRIFQHLSVPEILQAVLKGLDADFEIQGTFHPRDYCAQYQESDFDFASRLMEEEGINYFFRHNERGHRLILANTPQSHQDIEGGPESLIFEGVQGGQREESRVLRWEKRQELRSGKVTLWDHCFELPHQHLDAEKTILETVNAGTVPQKLKIGQNEMLERYEYPGAYAQRFDGVDKGGGDRASDIQKIFEDNKRTVGIRMQQETLPGLLVVGESTCRHLVAGHKFALTRHYDADGDYVLTSVTHKAVLEGDYRSGGPSTVKYGNEFTCIPSDLPYRPERRTPRPIVTGPQTAVVVGPAGEEIFTDKYGRVKVQFHWDREGQRNLDSSCWIRVAQLWAGRRWGASFWPRVGQEVVVAFEHGDPDRPIIIGSVYNADQMPPYQGNGPDAKHVHDNKVSGIKTNTTPGGVGYNELRFDDTKDKQQVFLHAERDEDIRVKNDCREFIGANRHMIVGQAGQKPGNQHEHVQGNKHLRIVGNQSEHIGGNFELLVGGVSGGNMDLVVKQDRKERIEKNDHRTVQGNRMEKVVGNESLTVDGSRAEKIAKSDSLTVGGNLTESIGGDEERNLKGDRKEKVGGSVSLTVSGDDQEKLGGKKAVEAGQEIHLKAGMKVVIEAGVQLTLKGPGGFVDIGPSGVTIQGIMVLINSGGAAGAGSGCSPTTPGNPQAPTAPQNAKEAQPAAPALADDALTGQKSN